MSITKYDADAFLVFASEPLTTMYDYGIVINGDRIDKSEGKQVVIIGINQEKERRFLLIIL